MKRELIGKHIKEERLRLGLTQTELGQLIGVSKQTLCGWENGRTMPGIATLGSIAKLCQKNLAFFIDMRSTQSLPNQNSTNTLTFGCLNEREKKLVNKLRSLSAKKREALEILLGFPEKGSLQK